LLAFPDVGRGLDNLTELICEIVIASHRTTVHCDTWSNGGRGNWQDTPLALGATQARARASRVPSGEGEGVENAVSHLGRGRGWEC
jgi:hypothetical protein